MINFDGVTKKDTKKYNPKWPQIPDHPYTILIIGGSGSRETNSWFNLTIHQPDFDKIYLYDKNPYEKKSQFLINKCESTRLKHFNNSKDCVEYSDDMNHIYKNIEEYNPHKKM